MILCLSCVVVFCTVYALILPAITLERKTVCGQEEHSHTEECYASDGQLTCGKTEHKHTESCYADDKTSEDRSGEDLQQTPEQNQTEGLEQNQEQTSDDGNVAQNGENGDTAGTTEDETSGNDEESVVAGSASAPAAEGEDGTGSATTEGFDLSADVSKVESVSLYYQEKDGNWKKIEENGSGEIPGDANIKLEVKYKGIQIQNLINNYDCTLTYDLPELLRNATPGGNIMEGSEIVGTLSISEGKIKVQFDQNYLKKKNDAGTTTIEGDFYITGEVNLSQLEPDGKKTLITAGKTYELDFGQDAIAKYGKVSVQKNCTSKKAISTTEGNFLSYTITVTAGEDGCPDVLIVDSFVTNSGCVTYVDITSTATDLESTQNAQKPYETMDADATKTHGKIYKGNAPTAEMPIPTEGETSIKEPESLVWKIGDMAPNESRTLTYYVKLKDDVALDNKEIKNLANVYSKTYKRVYGDATFTPKISYTMPKSRVGNIEKDTEGSYTINYRLDFTLDQANSNYPLENFVFQDYLKHDSNATASEALPYISYDRTSVHVFVKKDGATDYTELKTEYSTSWSNDMNTYKTNWSDSTDGNPNSFKISGTEGKPIQVNPGDSYYVTYSVKVKPEALAAVKSDNVRVNNRWIASASNANKDFKTGFNAWNNNNDVGGYKWDEKIVGDGTTADRTIEMTGDKYNLTNGKIQFDTSANASFTVPAGSYPYTVDVNQTLGDWNATEVLMKDTLDSDKMQYTGYAKVEAYSYNAGTKAYDLYETKWVKIDGLKTFELQPSKLGWSSQNYAYKFTYYAKPVNTDTFSTAIVNNKFELSGNVIRGDEKFDITGIYSQKEVTISGEYSMSVKKESWYYEKPEAGATEWTKGKIYWVIEVSGTAIKEGTYFKDSIASGSDLTNSIIRAGSLAEIYKGVLPDGKTLTGYSSLEELKKDATNLTKVTENFDILSQSDNELQVKAKEKIELGQEKLYIIVRTEPEALPVKDRDYNTYRNSISTSDDGKTWIKQGEANKLLCGAGDILKEFGQSFTYDGTTVISKKDGRDDGDTGKIAKDALPGAGQYASWVFKLNYAGELSGTYRVLETIPKGMELAYIRIKWTGTQQGTITSKEDPNLERDGWERKTVTAGTDNNRNETTIYYVKDNKALIELGDFVNGKIRDDYSVDVQVVCKVTDQEVLLGGKTKTFTNQVILQTENGQNINTATSPADITAQKIEKSMTTTNPVSEKVNFTIKVNQLGQTLPTVEGTTLKLIDKMSSTLILDTTTIQVVNSKDDKSTVDFKASLGEDNTLTIEIPCNVPVTITYTARVNAPPGQSVSFSNEAYWETYTSSSGTSVDQKDYSYTAGGTVGSGKNITLKIIKKDQYNLSLGLEGAVFRLKKCTRNADGTITENTDESWDDGTTNSNGEIQFGAGTSGNLAMDYNTLYQVTEVTAPTGYVKDDTPHYIMVPRKVSGATEYSDYVKKCMEDSRISIQYQSIYELTISNHKGEITVEKKFKNPGGHDSNSVSGTYKFGLYENAEGNGKQLQTIFITYDAGEKTTKSNKFVNLELTKNYYVFELDDSGNPIKDSSTVATVNGMEYFTSYAITKADGTTTGLNSASNGDTVTVTNQSRVNKLPSTGSCGVLIYRLAGAILILFAVVLMLMKYKETKTRN